MSTVAVVESGGAVRVEGSIEGFFRNETGTA